MNKFKTILFDADGTLFDFDKAETFALQNALAELNLPYNEIILQVYKQINASLWLLLEQGKTTVAHLRNKRFEILFEQFNLIGDPSQTCDMFFKYLMQAVFFLEGAQDILEYLHKTYDLYLVTNGVTVVQESRFALSGISKYFTAMYTSEELGISKPDKKYFDIVFERAGLTDPKSVLIVGDSLTSDITGGNNAGIATCWYNPENKTNTTDSICDWQVSRLSELKNIL
ncbi:MAG: noncanonical pyrimidine nucleotidase, YjjG family [Clostridia bacterium]|jgi:2-haloacid dehalogenase|nr:noncanonical pyrimidine nucleotidase, YjjG family [Clostridia bacterium]MBT7122495.1 noncanonical pyrimidine nucleotidase, YjjG family [Clostridia bacterium]